MGKYLRIDVKARQSTTKWLKTSMLRREKWELFIAHFKGRFHDADYILRQIMAKTDELQSIVYVKVKEEQCGF